MKKPAALVMAMLMALLIAACGGGGSVIGKWLNDQDGEDLTLTFYEDGRVVLSDDGDRTNGTYSGKSLKIGRDAFNMEIKGNRLVLTFINKDSMNFGEKLFFMKSSDGESGGRGGSGSGGSGGRGGSAGGGKNGFINECMAHGNDRSYCERSWETCVTERGAAFCGNPNNWQ